MPHSGGVHAARWSTTTVSLVLGACLASAAPCADADGLKDLIKNLYGPEGILLEPSPPPFSHRPHFSASSLQGLDSLNSALASSVTTLSPSISVGGFTFDVERGVPLPTSQNLGPLLAERAETLGKGRLNIAATYTRVHYTRFEGTPLTDLSLDFKHELLPGGPFDFERDLVHVNLSTTINQEILAFFGTYGLTDKWDVAIVVPVEHIFMGVTADASIVRNSAISAVVHNFGPNSSPQHLRVTDSATGLGDVFLRTKYNFLRNSSKYPDLSVVGQVRLPTGDESELLGTGDTETMVMLVASKPLGSITPHLNLGYEVSSGSSSENALRYVVGFDTRLSSRLTAAVEILGLWKPQGNGFGDNIVDFAVGAKWDVVRNFLIGANIQVPINKNSGLRADYIWTVGAEYTF